MAKKTGTAVATWDEELSKRSEVAAAQARTSQTGNKFFSLKSGVLSFDGKPMPNNEANVIILEGMFANTHYAGKFDPGNPASPDCYAFGQDAQSMTPHDNVGEDRYSDRCATCENNVFGSALEGAGKACKNTYRLAIIAAGNVTPKGKFEQFSKEEDVLTQEMGYLMIPVTSLNKQYLAYVKHLHAGVMTGGKARPPEGVVTKMKLVPDSDNQFKLEFHFAGMVDPGIQGAVMRRRSEAVDSIAFPYPKNEAKPVKAKSAKKGKENPAKKARKYQ